MNRTLAVGVGALVALSGCITSRAEGDALRQDMVALKKDVAELQRQSGDQTTREQGRLAAMEQRCAGLEQTLASLRQADADSGVQLEKVVAEVQALRGEIEQARHELGETTASVQSILARPPVSVAAAASAPKVADANEVIRIGGQDVPKDAKAHYDFAKKLYDEKKYTDAANAFDVFLQRHADNKDLVDNAAYWKAESTFADASGMKDQKAKEKALKQAILAYQRVLETPQSEKADAALLKIGKAFEQLGFKDEAIVFYGELVKKYADSPLTKDAKERLKALGASKKKAK